MPSIVEKPTATRSNNLLWSGMCLKTALDSDVAEEDLEVLTGFNGSNTQGHYVPICKCTPEFNLLYSNYRANYTNTQIIHLISHISLYPIDEM